MLSFAGKTTAFIGGRIDCLGLTEKLSSFETGHGQAKTVVSDGLFRLQTSGIFRALSVLQPRGVSEQ